MVRFLSYAQARWAGWAEAVCLIEGSTQSRGQPIVWFVFFHTPKLAGLAGQKRFVSWPRASGRWRSWTCPNGGVPRWLSSGASSPSAGAPRSRAHPRSVKAADDVRRIKCLRGEQAFAVPKIEAETPYVVSYNGLRRTLSVALGEPSAFVAFALDNLAKRARSGP